MEEAITEGYEEISIGLDGVVYSFIIPSGTDPSEFFDVAKQVYLKDSGHRRDERRKVFLKIKHLKEVDDETKELIAKSKEAGKLKKLEG